MASGNAPLGEHKRHRRLVCELFINGAAHVCSPVHTCMHLCGLRNRSVRLCVPAWRTRVTVCNFESIFLKFTWLVLVHPWVNPIVFENNGPNYGCLKLAGWKWECMRQHRKRSNLTLYLVEVLHFLAPTREIHFFLTNMSESKLKIKNSHPNEYTFTKVGWS